MAEGKSPDETSPSGSVTLMSLIRRLSMRKKRPSQEAPADVTDSNTKPVSPDTQKLPTMEDGIIWTKRFTQMSFKRKSLQEILKSFPKSAMDKENTNDFDFTYTKQTAPLSVMEINNLIDKAALKDAYRNILSLRDEVHALGEKTSSGKLAHKEEDLKLLVNALRDKMMEIVSKSCIQTSCNKELLRQVGSIIQDNEKREENIGQMGGWRDNWRTAIQAGVKETLRQSTQDIYEQNVSCLEEHFKLLEKNIVKLLEMVKAEVLNLYPSSFQVFKTYVSACHEFVDEHLKVLLEKIMDLKDCNAMLDFINRYQSLMINSPSLQPEIKEQKIFTLSSDLLCQIKKAYCDCLQKDLYDSLDNAINAEWEEVWKKKVTPKMNEKFLISEICTVVCEMIMKHSDNCAKIDENLEKMAICKCMEALKHFPKRFEEKFSKQSCSLLGSDLLDGLLWAQYQIAYINSFGSLKEHIEGYKEKCPKQVEELVTEVDGLTGRLRQALLQQFRVEIEPYLGGLMTKNWLNIDTDFNELVNRIEIYSGYSKSMRHPPSQSFTNDVHYHVAKGYISELLRNKYSCKGKKNEDAAAKIREQWTQLKKLFSEMGSTLDWLHSVGFHISEIIEQKNEKDMKHHLAPLVENYPDVSKKQLSAILYFRDSGFKFERSPAIRYFTELKQKIDNGKTENTGHHDHIFFGDMKVGLLLALTEKNCLLYSNESLN